MSEGSDRIVTLILKHLKEELLPVEETELRTWIGLSEENRLLFLQLTDADQLQEEIKEFHEARINIKEKIDARLQGDAVITHSLGRAAAARRIWVYAAAACMILLIGAILYLRINSSKGELAKLPIVSSPVKKDIRPGTDKAVLILASGATILLDSSPNGRLAEQGSTNISKNNGLIAYTASKTENPSSALTYNTLTTPRSGQFQIVLPDHTKVWLNNASQLRYPTSFRPGMERLVELSGEAYFEVAKDPSRPFKVKVNDLSINVLGTSFNVMAYSDENAIRTTLLEGKVKLVKADGQALLKPDEQAELSPSGKWKVDAVDGQKTISWTKGFFHFDHSDIRAVMRQLSRWYDVEIEYRGPVTQHLYGGDIHRDITLSVVLENLEKNDVHFSIEGNKIIVTK